MLQGFEQGACVRRRVRRRVRARVLVVVYVHVGVRVFVCVYYRARVRVSSCGAPCLCHSRAHSKGKGSFDLLSSVDLEVSENGKAVSKTVRLTEGQQCVFIVNKPDFVRENRASYASYVRASEPDSCF